MNHDYAHCADMTDKCPKGCFRAQLTRDLKAGMVVSFMHMKNTDECPLTKKDRVMEIVIKLTEDDFKKVQDGRAPVTVMRNAIRNGTPLPKGHGDLKDIAKIEEAFWNNNLIDKNMDSIDNGESQKIRRAMIRTMYLDVPTIIEADKEGE